MTASQFPCEISITGINFNLDQDLPPQGVGPSMTQGYLTNILDCPLNRIPGGTVDPHFCDERLNGGIIGCTTRVLTDRAIRGIILTTQGDIFTEDWYFNKLDGQGSHKEHSNSIRSWCMDFQSCEKESPTQIDYYFEEKHQSEKEVEEIPKNVDEDKSSGNDEELLQEFESEAPDLTAKLLESAYEEVSCPALTKDREDQEKAFETYEMDILEGGIAELYPRDYLPYFGYRDDYYEGNDGYDDDDDDTDE